MSKFVYLLFVVVAGLFIASCSDESSTAPTKEEKKAIMPLAVGNEWEYGITIHDEGGHNNSASLIIKVVGMEEIEGKSIYEMLVGNENSYLLLEEDGLYNYTKSGGKEYIEVKYPVAKGDTYIQNDAGNTTTFTVESLDKQLETEAGIFTTIKYVGIKIDEEAGEKYYDELYYCPGVGMIKSEEYMTLDGEEEYRNTMVLKSYKLK